MTTGEIGITSTSVRGVGGGGGLGPVLPTQNNIATWENSTTLKDSGVPISYVGITRENYIHAYDTTTQAIAVANTFQPLNYNTNAIVNGWTHTVGTNAFTCPVDGLYLISMGTVVNKTVVAGIHTAETRLLINGMEAIGSQSGTELVVSGQTLQFTKIILLSFVATDILTVEFASSTTGMETTVLTSVGGATSTGSYIVIERIA